MRNKYKLDTRIYNIFYIIESIQFLCVKYDNVLRTLTIKNYQNIINYLFSFGKKIMNVF